MKACALTGPDKFAETPSRTRGKPVAKAARAFESEARAGGGEPGARTRASLKYEDVYLYAYDDVAAARAGIGRYLAFYNESRPHQALGYQTPAAFYDTTPAQRSAARSPIACALRPSPVSGETGGFAPGPP